MRRRNMNNEIVTTAILSAFMILVGLALGFALLRIQGD